MARKKLQLSTIKVKSFVTTLGKKEQKTSKGGFLALVQQNRFFRKAQLGAATQWTEYKTRFNVERTLDLTPGGDENNNTSSLI